MAFFVDQSTTTHKQLTFTQLEAFIRDTMRMSHIYQPVMLRTLLEQGGRAEIEDIAKALLSYDRLQVEWSCPAFVPLRVLV